jgi:endo-1,4-beta-xylanase
MREFIMSKLFDDNRWCIISIILLFGVLFLTGCTPKDRDFPTSPTLSELADQRGILIGTAVQPDLIANEPQYAEILAAQFNSITSESHMKWRTTEPQHMTYTWDNADAVAAFAIANNQTIRGHTLVWPNEFQYQNIPDYVRNAPDAATMQQYIDDHIEAVVTRYAHVVDRWDVINEPLETLGAGVDQNIITATLGQTWMVRAFQQTRSLDPDAKLYINEALAERPEAKHDGLLVLVEALLDAGAPIDGVGLQGHFLVGTPSAQELMSVMQDWEALGLEVAITELDIVTWLGNEGAQAVQYENVMTTCLSVAACGEVTFWGFTDKHSWLNSFIGAWSTPLLFDADYLPKPAYAAVSAALAGAGN